MLFSAASDTKWPGTSDKTARTTSRKRSGASRRGCSPSARAAGPRCSRLTSRRTISSARSASTTSRSRRRAGSSSCSDPGSFEEADASIESVDPLGFRDSKRYGDRLRAARRNAGGTDAVRVGAGRIEGQPVEVGVFVFEFMGGSMGSVVGEKVTRVFERALERRVPAVVFSASGGARMQEGVLSLMQMAKTSAALGRLREAGLPYISVLLHPTTGGVAASFAMLGDVILAEPKALIGFAGARVIQNTIRQRLPPGFQRAEFLLDHGFLDKIVHRRELRATLASLLRFLGPRTAREPMAYADLLARLAGVRALGVDLGLERMREALARLGDPQRGPARGADRGDERQGVDRGDDGGDPGAGGPADRPLHLAPPLPLHRADPDRRPGDRRRLAGAARPPRGRPPACRSPTSRSRPPSAFLAMAENGVEVAVLETGLGGRLDAVTTAEPLATAITSIGLDHTAYLGDTLGAIAREKAGILKPGRALLPRAAPGRGRGRDRARRRGGGRPPAAPRSGLRPSRPSRSASRGGHQRDNAALAVALAKEVAARLGRSLDDGSTVAARARGRELAGAARARRRRRPARLRPQRRRGARARVRAGRDRARPPGGPARVDRRRQGRGRDVRGARAGGGGRRGHPLGQPAGAAAGRARGDGPALVRRGRRRARIRTRAWRRPAASPARAAWSSSAARRSSSARSARTCSASASIPSRRRTRSDAPRDGLRIPRR